MGTEPPPLIPLEHFFDNPARAGARISPDGRSLSWIAPVDGVLNVWVGPRAGGDGRPVTADRDRGVRAYFWSRDSRRILYLQDEGGDENTHLYAVDPERPGRIRDLTPFAGVKAGIVAVPRATPRQIVVSLNLRRPDLFDAYRLTLATGRLERVGDNPGNVQWWVADRAGRVRAARATTPEGDHEILARAAEARPFRTLARFANEDGGSPYGFRADGAALYIASARDRDLQALVELDLATGAERVIDADEEADLRGPIVSDRDGALLGAIYLRDRQVVHHFDERLARDWARLAEIHPGDPWIVSQDAEETTWIVAFEDDRDAGATYLVARDGGEVRFLHRPRPWLDPAALAPMRPVAITSRDGLTRDAA